MQHASWQFGFLGVKLLQVRFTEPWEFWVPFVESARLDCFRNNTKNVICTDICTERGAEAMVGKTAGIYTQIKPGAPNCWLGPRYSLSPALAIKEKSAVSLKNVFREAVKIATFIKSWNLSCMTQTEKLPYGSPAWSTVSVLKKSAVVTELWAELAAFLTAHQVYLKELTNCGSWAETFLKLTKWACCFKGDSKVYTANDKILGFKQKFY